MRDVTRALVKELLDGRSITASPFGEVEGRVDLRGLPADMAIGRVSVAAGGRWEALDLSGAGLTAMNWTDLTVADCVLEDAQLEQLRCWGITVADCRMSRAELKESQLGAPVEMGYKRSQWLRVDLRRADLRGAHADARFEAVDFSRARFARTKLGWSDLVDVRFAGVIRGLAVGRLPVSKRPPDWTLDGVDLTAAQPRNLDLVGVDLGAVDMRLPADDGHWVVPDWPAFLGRVGQAVAALPAGDLRRVAEIWHEYAVTQSGPRQSQGFVATYDLLALGGVADVGPELVDLLAGLRSAPATYRGP